MADFLRKSLRSMNASSSTWMQIYGRNKADDTLKRYSVWHLFLLFRDPLLNLFVENIERQRAAAENFIVKRANIEFGPEFLFGVFAQFQNLELPQLVRQRLSWPTNIAVDFGLDVRFIHRGVFMEILDHLIARPVFGVYSCVDHQPNIAPHFIFEAAIFAVRVLITA